MSTGKTIKPVLSTLTSAVKDAAKVLEDELLFPKLHILLIHALEDLRGKGLLKHYNTILGKAKHPSFKEISRRQMDVLP